VPFSQRISEKGIREFTGKLSLPARDHGAFVGLVKAGFGSADEPVTVKGISVRPLDVLQAVIDRNIAKNRHRSPPRRVTKFTSPSDTARAREELPRDLSGH
jgi:hypothetical protein